MGRAKTSPGALRGFHPEVRDWFLDFRGEVRRGYFVKGLGGAQFALPDAVERLRAVGREEESGGPIVVMGASDPAARANFC